MFEAKSQNLYLIGDSSQDKKAKSAKSVSKKENPNLKIKKLFRRNWPWE